MESVTNVSDREKNRNHTPGVGVLLQQAPGKRIKKVILEKKHAESINIKLGKGILIDRQSTMDILCNKETVERIYKSKNKMRIRSNGRKMVIDYKSVVAG